MWIDFTSTVHFIRSSLKRQLLEMNPGNTPLKVFNRTPPAKGSFPLDHDGECREYMRTYMNCLKHNKNCYEKCLQESKKYLECRMERDLMTPEDFQKLGFKEEEESGS